MIYLSIYLMKFHSAYYSAIFEVFDWSLHFKKQIIETKNVKRLSWRFCVGERLSIVAISQLWHGIPRYYCNYFLLTHSQLANDTMQIE